MASEGKYRVALGGYVGGIGEDFLFAKNPGGAEAFPSALLEVLPVSGSVLAGRRALLACRVIR